MKKVMLVFGTRPEAVKMCPLVKALKSKKDIETVVCLTGQHKDMLAPVLNAFGVTDVKYNLDIMKERQTLFDITLNVLTKIRDALSAEQPDLVLVHGDTSSAFAASLACFYLKIPVGHVEAGLRTYDLFSPYPEEFNRQAISITAKLNFAPTEWSKNNLIRGGLNKEQDVFVTGNTVIDALKTTVRENYSHPQLDWAQDSKLVILTAHRRENIGDHMKNMFKAILRVTEKHPEIKIIYPVHLNPAVKEAAAKYLGGNDRIRIIPPLDVVDFHNFLSRSYMILTDSGGIQEEASALKKPVLVMRDTTERPEGVEAGTLKLVGTDENTIYEEFDRLLTDKAEYDKMSSAKNPYGDGNASIIIADIIENFFNGNPGGDCEENRPHENVSQITAASAEALLPNATSDALPKIVSKNSGLSSSSEPSRIPKVIHYVWVGRAPKPQKVIDCMESWKKFCPDYKIVEWNEDNFDVNSNLYVKQAYECKKYAFVSDYIRLWALYNFGGVYLDTDVELLCPLDKFLRHGVFTGFENKVWIPTAVLGAEQNHPYIKLLLDYYADRSFIKKNNKPDLTTNVSSIGAITRHHYNIKFNDTYQELDGDVAFYPHDTFCPKNYVSEKIEATENTCAIHHFNGSWLTSSIKRSDKFVRGVRKLLGEKLFEKCTVKYFRMQYNSFYRKYKRELKTAEKKSASLLKIAAMQRRDKQKV